MATSKKRPEDDGLEGSNWAHLNRLYFERQPWVYFQQRLGCFVLLASNDATIRSRLAEGVALGSLTIAVSTPEDPDPPTPAQTFAAVEGQVLLHHAAETLLRFVYAQADSTEPCPWMRMSRLVSAGEFKSWVDDALVSPELEATFDLVRQVFNADGWNAHQTRVVGSWLRLFAREFLDSGPYNAAKHGMALDPGAEEFTLRVAEESVLKVQGASLGWLTRVTGDDGTKRWAEVTRISSIPMVAATVDTAARLMKGVLDRGRVDYLGHEAEALDGVADPEVLRAALDVDHHILVTAEKPLAYADVPGVMRIRFPAPRNGR